MIITTELNSDGKLTEKQIREIIQSFDIAALTDNILYYDADNPRISEQQAAKTSKSIVPNEKIPSPYAATLSDTIAGYSFSKIDYLDNKADENDNEKYLKDLKEIYRNNNRDTKDLQLGTMQVGYGASYCIHYVDKTSGKNKYRFTPVTDPRSIVPIFNTSIEPELIAFIYLTEYKDEKGKDVFRLKVYFPEFIDTYETKDLNIKKAYDLISENVVNDYGTPPLEYYFNNFDMDKIVSCFHKVKHYIDAVDAVLSGNWNEIEKFADAILLAMKRFTEDDMTNMKNKRVIEKLTPDEIKHMRYLTKEVQFEYQEWFYKALVSEIHKHTHILDYQNPDTGFLNAESAKALIYRHTDQDTIAKKYELQNRIGQYRRMELLNSIEAIDGAKNKNIYDIDVKYNHVLPEDVKEKIEAVNNATFLSNQTKQEHAGLVDPKVEQQRIEDEKTTINLDDPIIPPVVPPSPDDDK